MEEKIDKIRKMINNLVYNILTPKDAQAIIEEVEKLVEKEKVDTP